MSVSSWTLVSESESEDPLVESWAGPSLAPSTTEATTQPVFEPDEDDEELDLDVDRGHLHLCGYTARRVNPERRRAALGSSELASGSTFALAPYVFNRLSTFPVDALDAAFPELSTAVSLNKDKRWERLTLALEEVATAKYDLDLAFSLKTFLWTRHQQFPRKVTVFDVPVVGQLVKKSGSDPLGLHVEIVTSSGKLVDPTRTGPVHRHPWLKAFKRATYYSRRLSNQQLGGAMPYEQVRPAFTVEESEGWDNSPVATAHPKVAAITEAKYKSMYGSAGGSVSRFAGPGLMYSREAVLQELHVASLSSVAYAGLGHYRSRQVFSGQHSRCWAAATTPSASFKDWYLELEFPTATQEVSHVLMLGRAPRVESFPLGQDGGNEDVLRENWSAWSKFPQFPCILEKDSQQFVKRVEISFRLARGKWTSLGVFQANRDVFSEAWITLPRRIQCKYLRLRPLSASEDGFVGKAPAMRVVVFGGVVATPTQSCARGVVPDNVSPENSNRYMILDASKGTIPTKVRRAQAHGPGTALVYHGSWSSARTGSGRKKAVTRFMLMADVEEKDDSQSQSWEEDEEDV